MKSHWATLVALMSLLVLSFAAFAGEPSKPNALATNALSGTVVFKSCALRKGKDKHDNVLVSCSSRVSTTLPRIRKPIIRLFCLTEDKIGTRTCVVMLPSGMDQHVADRKEMMTYSRITAYSDSQMEVDSAPYKREQMVSVKLKLPTDNQTLVRSYRAELWIGGRLIASQDSPQPPKSANVPEDWYDSSRHAGSIQFCFCVPNYTYANGINGIASMDYIE